MHQHSVGGRYPDDGADHNQPVGAGADGLPEGEAGFAEGPAGRAGNAARRRSVRGRVAVGTHPYILGAAADDECDGQGQEDDEHARPEHRVAPAEAADAPVQQEDDESAAAGEGGHQGGHRHGAAADEPLVDGGHQGLPEAGAFAH